MDLARKLARLIPGCLRSAGEQPDEILFGIHYQAEAEFVHLDHSRGAVHHFTHRRPLIPNNHRVGHDCAEPMEEVQYLWPTHAREKVFVTAGEADHFMWKDRASNEDLIILKQQTVHFH